MEQFGANLAPYWAPRPFPKWVQVGSKIELTSSMDLRAVFSKIFEQLLSIFCRIFLKSPTSAKWHHYGTKRTFVTFTLFLVDTVLMSIFTLQTCKNRTENLKNWRQKLIKFTIEKYTSIYLHFDPQNDAKIDLISPPIRATFLSKNVRTCQKMSENVRKCHQGPFLSRGRTTHGPTIP